ncbi:hypothetical protein [Micromonospora inositola]|uniref:Uncharacterized protein n=1 Tax=Micromonospora inositola TaxID=47865 RepID=A0A1C5K2R3_9ACTN|nr:hypothetical protein [Micromonospora inositola]SCG77114.1 hypothetical protein GA0070613_6155 [Micromonospora inositola]
MRRLAVALAAGGIAVIGFAAPAQADPGDNWTYGHCVTAGYANPSGGSIGPTKMNPQGNYKGAVNAFYASDGHAHFNGAGMVCPKPE